MAGNGTSDMNHYTTESTDIPLNATSLLLQDKNSIHTKNWKIAVHPSVIAIIVVVFCYVLFLVIYYFVFTRRRKKLSLSRAEKSGSLRGLPTPPVDIFTNDESDLLDASVSTQKFNLEEEIKGGSVEDKAKFYVGTSPIEVQYGVGSSQLLDECTPLYEPQVKNKESNGIRSIPKLKFKGNNKVKNVLPTIVVPDFEDNSTPNGVFPVWGGVEGEGQGNSLLTPFPSEQQPTLLCPPLSQDINFNQTDVNPNLLSIPNMGATLSIPQCTEDSIVKCNGDSTSLSTPNGTNSIDVPVHSIVRAPSYRRACST